MQSNEFNKTEITDDGKSIPNENDEKKNEREHSHARRKKNSQHTKSHEVI